MEENLVVLVLCLRGKVGNVYRRMWEVQKRFWATLKRKATVGVRKCEACQRYS